MRYTFDSREVKPGMAFVALKGEKVDGHDFIERARAAGAVKIVDGLAALQREALAYRRTLRATVIGVTGSAGKTTTKEFLKALLDCYGTEGNFNNHIGLPMTILNCPADAEFLVVEMGTNHPGEIAALCDIAEPDAGVLVSVGNAHIEFFGTRENIEAEKLTLLRRAKRLALRWDDPTLEEPPFACPLPGEHNRSNMRLAYNLARRLGVSAATCAERIGNFRLPGARWRKSERGGIVFIDDTYNANPDSMIAALNALVAENCRGRRVAILGDMFELGAQARELHRGVFAHARALGLPLVLGVGELSSQCDCDLAFRTPEELGPRLSQLLSAGDVVLLKASHGMELARRLGVRSEK